MSEARNIQVARDAYAAFLRGDINAILTMLDDHVEWQAVIGTEGVAPHAGLRKGRAAVGQFFEQVAGAIKFDRFEPREFIAQGDQVAVVGHYTGKTLPNDGPFDTEWVMVFTMRNGKVTKFREFTDSAQLVRAYTGVPA